MRTANTRSTRSFQTTLNHRALEVGLYGNENAERACNISGALIPPFHSVGTSFLWHFPCIQRMYNGLNCSLILPKNPKNYQKLRHQEVHWPWDVKFQNAFRAVPTQNTQYSALGARQNTQKREGKGKINSLIVLPWTCMLNVPVWFKSRLDVAQTVAVCLSWALSGCFCPYAQRSYYLVM